MLLWDYQDMGYTRYRLITNGDTCEDCTSLNGKIFSVDKAESGENFPPMHPNCDCTFEIVDEQGNSVVSNDERAEKEKDDKLGYLNTSLKQIVLGNYTDDVTLLGTIGQMILGLIGVDLPADIRDLFYDVTNWENTKEHIFQTALDSIALVPLVGGIKYADEAAELIQTAAKHGDEAADAVKAVKRTSKEVAKAAEKLGFIPTGQYSHGQPVFKKGNRYITPDIDSHNGGVWKMANSIKNLRNKKTRLGTYDANLDGLIRLCFDIKKVHLLDAPKTFISLFLNGL